MIKVDMHCHSLHSKHPSEWFLQRLGARESYTEVETVYRLARQRGMDAVTLTDHNTIEGALELRERHPADTFISVESTAYFPDDNCKVHILCYDITPAQFAMIQALRENIYELREYLRREDIACSVAHATYSVNGRLRVETLEKLILLFDVFEGINGGRAAWSNRAWIETLQQLTPNMLARLAERHGIEPWRADSWIKGFTGGSDDHAGLLIGQTWTTAAGDGVGDLIAALRARETLASGRHGDHKTLAFAIYKVACDFSLRRAHAASPDLWRNLNNVMFGRSRLGWRNWLTMQAMKRRADPRQRIVTRFIEDLLSCAGRDLGRPETMDHVYGSLTHLSDDFFAMLFKSLEQDVRRGDIARVVANISAVLPAGFLTAPFFATLWHMHSQRGTMADLRRRLGQPTEDQNRRTLWFSDTVTDLNGVSMTLRGIAEAAHATGRNLRVVTSVPDTEVARLPVGTLNLPCIYTFSPEFYQGFTLRVPSILGAMDMIAAENPREIVISTPGPVGLIGLLCARLLGIPCTGIYHTDFTRQADCFIGDERMGDLIEAYTHWFFGCMDVLRVPTEQYIGILEKRGFDRSRMRVFRRHIEAGFVRRDPAAQAEWRRKLDLGSDYVLMWAGRCGKEKNLDFLMRLFERTRERRPDVSLVMAGDGPELPALRAWAARQPGVRVVGRLPRAELADLYGMADLFVFPSTTETFGMVVLEAQACGLPALVSDIGGCQEIVSDGETGQVLSVHDPELWVEAILGAAHARERAAAEVDARREAIRRRFAARCGWEGVIDDIRQTFAAPVGAAVTDPACASVPRSVKETPVATVCPGLSVPS